MKKITLLMLFMSALWGHSQVKNYTFTQSNGAYPEINAGTALGNESSNGHYFIDPNVKLGNTSNLTGPGFPIGFNFVFNGYSYDRFAVNTNGWIGLGTSTLSPSVNMSGANNATPISSAFGWSPEVLSARIAPFARA